MAQQREDILLKGVNDLNELQIFSNPEFGSIRTVDQNGEPWFVGKDVAAALGYSNHRKALIDHVAGQGGNKM